MSKHALFFAADSEGVTAAAYENPSPPETPDFTVMYILMGLLVAAGAALIGVTIWRTVLHCYQSDSETNSEIRPLITTPAV